MKNTFWIWTNELGLNDYNQAVWFKREFEAPKSTPSLLRITACSAYRVWLNGQWIHDGPGRSYPHRYTYDTLDLGGLLKEGTNQLEVHVRFFGIGTYLQVDVHAGLLAEIELPGQVIRTDATWSAAIDRKLHRWVPKLSAQSEPCELIDSRRSDLSWHPARELFKGEDGAWKNLTACPARQASTIAVRPEKIVSALRLLNRRPYHCVPVNLLVNPGLIESNTKVSRPVILTAILNSTEPVDFSWDSADWTVSVDGRVLENATTVSPGRHAVVFFCKKFYSHIKHLHFPFLALAGAEWQDWRVFVRDELAYRGTDMVFQNFPNKEAEAYADRWSRFVEEHASDWHSPAQEPDFGKQVSCEPERLFMVDFTAEFRFRQPGTSLDLEALDGLVSSRPVVIDTPLTGDVEICLDFGREVSGFFQLEVEAGAGTMLDLHLVEFISRDGQVQHMWPYNHNGMRYVCSTGRNRHLSLKKRAGRYLFLSIRNASSPVVIHAISVVDATAGIEPVASFQCDDPLLNRIWEISERTLKMTMNDVLTDASPYEQALWVGDARNIALYTNQVYANPLPSRQSLRVIADSLEQFPIVGCCVPNRWEILIPIWSFLWGLHVWEYYFHTDDREFLKSIWPAVEKNITGAESFLNKDGLFSGPLWNFFDWAPIDQNQETVLHNSMFMVAAYQAAQKCANALGKQAAADSLSQKRSQLVAAINRFWDPVKGSYPDAVLADGTPSTKTCQHTSILALLYDIADDSMKADLLRNLTTPPQDMTTIRSPFAAHYLYEAMEKLGSPQTILADIRRNYQPMIDMGATTVWETYPESTLSNNAFPTRSHCHGWSCGPIYFFNRIILGIHPVTVGCREVRISPWIQDLTHAKGGMATPCGTVEVRWERLPDNKLLIEIHAPDAITIRLERNESWGDRQVLSSGDRAIESPARAAIVEPV